jgi:tetratricopeptide (TPR) repeat protein
MRYVRWLPRMLAGGILLSLCPSGVRAQEVPIGVLSEWKFYNNSAWMYLNKGDYIKAEERFKLAIRMIRPYPVKCRRLLARSYADLARTLYHEGRYAEAEPLAKWALTVREENVKANPDAVFQSLYTLALIDAAQARFPESESLLRRALELQEKGIGPRHVQMAATLDELAGMCVEQRKFDDAERFYRRAIAILEQFDPDENLELAACIDRYVVLLKRLDRTQEADKMQGRAAAIRHTVQAKAELARAKRSRPTFKGFK